MIELVDVLTADGTATSVRKPKPDVHRDGDWHRAVHVWIVGLDGRVLLQRRSLRKENNPGLWDVSVAGHVSAGEDMRTSALREAEEEIGISLDVSELQHIATIPAQSVLNDGTYLDNEFHEIFVVRRDVDLASLRLQDGEVDDVALVPPSALLERTDLVPHGEEYRRVYDWITRARPRTR